MQKEIIKNDSENPQKFVGFGSKDFFLFLVLVPHILQIALRKILVVYGCPVFLKPNQNIRGLQNFTHLIFSMSLGRFEIRLKTTDAVDHVSRLLL